MELKITIFAVIWFVLLTCLGNISLLHDIIMKREVKLKPWAVIGDILATSWLLKMVVQWVL